MTNLVARCRGETERCEMTSQEPADLDLGDPAQDSTDKAAEARIPEMMSDGESPGGPSDHVNDAKAGDTHASSGHAADSRR